MKYWLRGLFIYLSIYFALTKRELLNPLFPGIPCRSKLDRKRRPGNEVGLFHINESYLFIIIIIVIVISPLKNLYFFCKK